MIMYDNDNNIDDNDDDNNDYDNDDNNINNDNNYNNNNYNFWMYNNNNDLIFRQNMMFKLTIKNRIIALALTEICVRLGLEV